MNIFDLFISIIIIFYTFKLTYFISNRYNIASQITFLITSWHLFFAIFYYLLSFIIRNDSLRYFNYAILGQLKRNNEIQFYDFNIGTNSIFEIIRLIVNYLNLDFFNLFLVFNLLVR